MNKKMKILASLLACLALVGTTLGAYVLFVDSTADMTVVSAGQLMTLTIPFSSLDLDTSAGADFANSRMEFDNGGAAANVKVGIVEDLVWTDPGCNETDDIVIDYTFDFALIPIVDGEEIAIGINGQVADINVNAVANSCPVTGTITMSFTEV